MKISLKLIISISVVSLATLALLSASSLEYSTSRYYVSFILILILAISFLDLKEFFLAPFVRALSLFISVVSLVYLCSSDLSGLLKFLFGSGPGIIFYMLLSMSYTNIVKEPIQSSPLSNNSRKNVITYVSLVANILISLSITNAVRFDSDMVLLRGQRLALAVSDINGTIAYQRISYSLFSLFLIAFYLALPSLLHRVYLVDIHTKSCKGIHHLNTLLVSLVFTFSIIALILSLRFFAVIQSNSGILLTFFMILIYSYYCFQFIVDTAVVKLMPNIKRRLQVPLLFFIGVSTTFLYVYSATDFGSLSALRIFNEDGLNLNSLYSRFALNSNFFSHLKYNVYVLGGFNVENFTTGEGSYSHSFILSLISHGGIVSLASFFPLLYLIIKETKSVLRIRRHLIPSCLLMLATFAFANVSTFFLWRPLFFVMLLHFSLSRYCVRSTKLLKAHK